MRTAVLTKLTDYSEYSVSPNSVELIEQMGSKPKFWYSPKDQLTGLWLYKETRAGTGDDWSEKIAGELAILLGLPCAQIELGVYSGARGTISKKFHTEETSLAHGNEMLTELFPDYPRPGETKKQLRVRQHTVEAIFHAFNEFQVGLPTGWVEAAGIVTAADMFTGYLLLDAWIGNTDRHHENWACVRHPRGMRVLAPTYDHAASMGALLRSEERTSRLNTNDNNFKVEAFACKALSALHATTGDLRPMLTVDAFRKAALLCPDAAGFWLGRLASLSDERIAIVIDRVPEQRMTPNDKLFVRRFLKENKNRLLS